MTTIVQPSTWITDENGVNHVQAIAKTASDLVPGEIVTNLGVIDQVTIIGVFVVASIRGTVWSLATGKGDVHNLDVVWHGTEQVSVDRL